MYTTVHVHVHNYYSQRQLNAEYDMIVHLSLTNCVNFYIRSLGYFKWEQSAKYTFANFLLRQRPGSKGHLVRSHALNNDIHIQQRPADTHVLKTASIETNYRAVHICHTIYTLHRTHCPNYIWTILRRCYRHLS